MEKSAGRTRKRRNDRHKRDQKRLTLSPTSRCFFFTHTKIFILPSFSLTAFIYLKCGAETHTLRREMVQIVYVTCCSFFACFCTYALVLSPQVIAHAHEMCTYILAFTHTVSMYVHICLCVPPAPCSCVLWGFQTCCQCASFVCNCFVFLMVGQ